ncbi:hypothetical protein Pcinc_005376 [Petrolisthes cinctipes]|uniref:Uncharacterized protein n=1 Tax=Petrolisthes cinctipes TaxID=88211 RepID=A0AAE1GDN1_PETCI|nr:hypothetical protein Pcinc_005376 [Petrolisthes cinctipes]
MFLLVDGVGAGGGGGHVSPRGPMISGTSCVVIQVGSAAAGGGRPTTYTYTGSPSSSSTPPSSLYPYPAGSSTLPSHSSTLPSHFSTLSSHSSTLPSHSSTLPTHSSTLPTHSSSFSNSSPSISNSSSSFFNSSSSFSNSSPSFSNSNSSANLPSPSSPSFQRPISFPSLGFLSSTYGTTQTRTKAPQGSLSLSQDSSSGSKGGSSDSDAVVMASTNIIKGPRDSFTKFGSVKFAKRNKKVSSSSSVGAAVVTSSGDGVDNRSSHSGTGKSGHGTMKPGHEGQDKPGTPTAPPVPKPRTLLPDGKLHTIKESPASSLSSPTSSLSSPTSSSSSTLLEGTKTRHRLELKLDLKPVYENASHLSNTREKNHHQAIIPDVVSMTHTEGKSHKKKNGNASSKNAEHGKPKFKINKHSRQQQQQQHHQSSPGIETHKHLQNSVIKDTGEEFTTRKNETTLLMSSDADWPTLQSTHLVKVAANKAKVRNPSVPEKSTFTVVPNPQKSSSVKVSGGVVSDKNMMKMMGACVPEKSTIITKTDPHTQEKSVQSSSNRTHTPKSTGSTNPLHAELMSKYSSSGAGSGGGGGGGSGRVSHLHKVKTKEPMTVQELFSGYKFNVYGDRVMDASGSDRLKMEQTKMVEDDSFSLYTSTDNNKENKLITKHGENNTTGKDLLPVKPERHFKKQFVSQEAPEPHKRIKKSVNFTEPSLAQGLTDPPGASGDGSKTPDQGLRSHHGSLRVPWKASGDDANSFNRGAATRKSYSKVVCIVNL